MTRSVEKLLQNLNERVSKMIKSMQGIWERSNVDDSIGRKLDGVKRELSEMNKNLVQRHEVERHEWTALTLDLSRMKNDHNPKPKSGEPGVGLQ